MIKRYNPLFEKVTFSQVLKAIENEKKKLKQKAKQKGIWENFGQKEVNNLKDKYNYTELVYGSSEERKIASLLDNFDNWCMDFSDSDI